MVVPLMGLVCTTAPPQRVVGGGRGVAVSVGCGHGAAVPVAARAAGRGHRRGRDCGVDALAARRVVAVVGTADLSC